MALRIRLASALAVDRDGETLSGQALGSRKARTLLALVAAARGAAVPLDRVSALTGTTVPHARRSMQTLYARSRRYATPQAVRRQAARIGAPKRANCAPV